MSDSMSSTILLKDRQSDATRELILSTAVDLLEKSGVTELTVRAVARAAGMSERTIFRYYATRDEFLDAVAATTARRMSVPMPPASIEELLDFPALLYHSFEDSSGLVAAVLHTDIYPRVRKTSGEARWQVVEKLIDACARGKSKKQRKIAATNINYFLSATTWHYYRTNFGLKPEDTVACAKTAIKLIIDDICGA